MTDQQTLPGSFGELLKVYRKRQQITQKQLAHLLNIHSNTILSWELGSYLPDTRVLVLELARHLGLNDLEARQLLEASLIALAPQWLVPLPRNPFFTGRENILQELHTRLGTDQMVAPTQAYALHGLGGIGKTQIALEYAYLHALEYNAIFWIGAETVERVLSSLLRIAELLNLPERHEADQQRIVAAVQRWLSTHSQWLLIWDNLEDLDLLRRFLPPTRQGAILVTTRSKALGTLAWGIELASMEQEEGMLFLLRRARMLQKDATSETLAQLAEHMPGEYAIAEKLVNTMGELPLALDQAGAYIEETGCSLADYLYRYEQQRFQLLDRRGVPGGDHPHSVAATFLLASERVEREQRAAADMLRLCALLHAEAIPEEIFVEGATHLGPELAVLTANPARFDQTIAVLRSLSLVQRDPETHTLSLHRLVQAVLRERMSEQEQAMWHQRMIHTLNGLFPEVTAESTTNIWRQCERLLPHVLAGMTTLPHQIEDWELARVLGKAADYLCERAQYEHAEPLYERALYIGEQVLGPIHPDMAYLLTGSANLYQEQGKFEQAEPLFQQAIRIREQALGPEHPLVAHPLNGLAILYRKQGKFGQAESLYERAISIRAQALGPEHPLMARLLYNLAHLYQEQGKYAQAEPLFQRSLRIEEQAWGPEHPHVTYPLNGLGMLYRNQGKDEQAEPLFQRALHLLEQALGPEHLLVAYPLHNLAALCQRQGKYEQAEQLSQRALRIAEQVLEAGNPQIAHPLNGLADLYARQGKYELARPLYQRALHIQEQALRAEHPDLATSLNGLANLYMAQGEYALAEPLYQRALRIREQHLGQDHPETAQTLYDMALFQQKQGHVGEALSLAQRALKIRAQSLGDTHPKTVATQALYTQLE
jgi:tetratricopeptide (TPR) repeat protein